MMPRASHPNEFPSDVSVEGLCRSGEGYHGVDELDTVVLGRVVTGRDHDSDGLAIELARPECGQESNSVYHRVEDVAVEGARQPGAGVAVEWMFKHTPSCGTRETVSRAVHVAYSGYNAYASRAILEFAHQLGGGTVFGRCGLDSFVVAHDSCDVGVM